MSFDQFDGFVRGVYNKCELLEILMYPKHIISLDFICVLLIVLLSFNLVFLDLFSEIKGIVVFATPWFAPCILVAH